MLRSFRLDAVHGCLEDIGVLVDFGLVFGAELGVDFVPVLRVLGLVRFGLPVGDVAFDKFAPYFGIGAAELGGCFL